jgi:ABC-type phosphate transport system permease subunit
LSHCMGNCRLASARHTVQPEYTFTASIASPGIYLSKEFHSSALVASGIVFLVVGVERGVVGGP